MSNVAATPYLLLIWRNWVFLWSTIKLLSG